MQADKKTTVPVPPAPTDGGQPYALPRTNSIAEDDSPRKSDSEILRNISRIALGALPSMTMPELMNQQFAARPAVVEGLLPMGTHLFSGAPKIGKSFFVLQLAYQVSTGEPFLGFPTRQGTVLYLALEDTYERLQRRLYRMVNNESEKLVLSIFSKNLDDGLIDQLKTFLQEYPDTVLIIIDTLQKIRSKGGEQYSYSSDYENIAQIKAFTDHHSLAVLLVHHTRKESAEDVFDTISGTNGLTGAADGSFVLHKDKRTSADAVLDVSSRDQQDLRLQMTFDRARCAWTLVKLETELYAEPPDPLLMAIGQLVTEAFPEWEGTATELTATLQQMGYERELTPNWLVRSLNIQQNSLLQKQGICYRSRRGRDGKTILLRWDGVR